jgi:hypothetical protein
MLKKQIISAFKSKIKTSKINNLSQFIKMINKKTSTNSKKSSDDAGIEGVPLQKYRVRVKRYTLCKTETTFSSSMQF